MGVASTDVSLTDNGSLATTRRWMIEFGYLTCLLGVDVLTIGTGDNAASEPNMTEQVDFSVQVSVTSRRAGTSEQSDVFNLWLPRIPIRLLLRANSGSMI